MTVTKAAEYRNRLSKLEDWDAFLLKESGLPGPRGNLELAQVVADAGNQALFERYLAYDADQAPTNSPYEFLAFCGVVGLGRLLAEGQAGMLVPLRRCASDRRWRIREGVATALQRLGDVDMDALVRAMRTWSTGTALEQRAAAAALCEPRLLSLPKHARAVLRRCASIASPHRCARLRIARAKILSRCAKVWATAGAWPWPHCQVRASG